MRTFLAVLMLLGAAPAAAQVPQQPPPQQPSPQDTIPVPQFRIQPPISPLGATLRSLVLPGWGQSILGRRVTGAVFIFFEGITFTMTLKSIHQLAYQEDTDAETVESKRQEIEDWAILWGFNHLVAAAEAFVAAQLWDFPTELDVRALPDGTTGLGLKVYW
jgi:hypothetical protein